MKKTDNRDLNLMIKVIKKYYELGMNQEQIAKEEFISKSSVCRLIKKAQENGFVSYKINYPMESIQMLEDEFHKRFQLDKIFITPFYTEDMPIRLQDTCNAVVDDICKMVRANDTIGISWGTTMEQVATALTALPNNKKCDKIIMMNGSLAGDMTSLKSSRTVERFADFFSAKGYILPVPLLVDSKIVANLIRSDSYIQNVMNMAIESQFAVLSVGGVSPQTVLMRRNAYTKEEFDELMSMGAVGDVVGRCFDMNGREVCAPIAERTIGIGLEELKKKRVRMGIAVGSHKIRAIIGALRGNLINMLYIDEMTALSVIEFLKNYETKQGEQKV
ncbi:MAG: sugar-binding domain-containing protein [Christensenella sp.]|uniref:sugar-binding transcriptional regulator n=1 Tax=Christensenella sp. TaxID=1935934 RepID=UPI002B1F525C|nr:sugar-binding domain-containing protein [Christensenella sp.]MEA5002108.1 sugar-binding domain-containing protein [Christensenella sp.]